VNPAKLAKIRALAEDQRGDPKVREVARRFLAINKPAFTPTPTQHPGLRTSLEYDKFLFMNLANWGKSKTTGNYVHDISWKGRAYTIILFKHKQTLTYGWLRTCGSTKDFSGKYNTLAEAHRDAWTSLTRL
jgi:hypothetical protein